MIGNLLNIIKIICSLLFFIFLSSCINSNKDNMGFFKNLFGKNEKSETPISKPSNLEKTAEMLDEDLYWKIVDISLKNSGNQDEQEQVLISEISKLTPKQMVGFRLRTDKLLYDTYTSEMWCASYIMNGGSSDDGFEYFRNWIISRGKDVYYKAKANPDTLISQKILQKKIFMNLSFFGTLRLRHLKKIQEKNYTII